MTSKDRTIISNLRATLSKTILAYEQQRKAATDSGQQASREADLRVAANREVERLTVRLQNVEASNQQLSGSHAALSKAAHDIAMEKEKGADTINRLVRLLDKAVESNQALLDAVNAKPKISVEPTTFDDLLRKIKF